MGRKSKTKKILKEEASKKIKESIKKSGFFSRFFKKKPTKKEVAEAIHVEEVQREKLLEKIKRNKKKLFGGALALIMLGILFSVGYLLFQKAFRAQPIAKILPAEQTIGFIEFNINFDHNQLVKSLNLLKNYPVVSKANLIKAAEKFLGADYEKDLQPWIGRVAGGALVNSKKDENQVYEIYFAEILSQKNIEDLLNKKNPTKNTYSNYLTYKVGDGYYVIINDYLIVSNGEQAIYELIDSQNSDVPKVSEHEQYRRIDTNLPLNHIVFSFINFEKLNDGVFAKYAFLNQSGFSFQMLKPFLKLVDAEGFVIVALEENFAIQSFLALDENIVSNDDYLSYEEKYNANLSSYVKDNTLVFWGANNLEAQIKKFVAMLSGGNEADIALFEAVFQNYTKQYFGPETSFYDDVLPLFQNEFAFVIEPDSQNKPVYKLLIELKNPQQDALTIQNLANNFASIGAVFEPKVVEHTLPDGTVGREIIAVPEEIIKGEHTYKDNKIYELRMGKQNWSVYYTVVNELALITSNIEGIKTTVDIIKDGKNNLKNTDIFTKSIEPVLNSSDEVSYLNLETVLPIVFKKQAVPEILKSLSYFSSGRNYFNDGIVTINYLHLK
ncbi:MAG: DUF3352 domain-containing protein [Patescibacteria group bacterium]